MTSCTGALSLLGLALLHVAIPFALVPAASAWCAWPRGGGGARFLPAALFACAAALAWTTSPLIDGAWIPVLLGLTALLWLPRSPRPFTEAGRAWLSYAAALSVLTSAVLWWESRSAAFCGLV